MKSLPKIYQNDILKKINNNKSKCYVLEKMKEESKASLIEVTLDEIFSGLGYAYNIPVIITTKNKTYHTSLIAKTKYNLVTLDNEVIPLNSIISLKKKKN